MASGVPLTDDDRWTWLADVGEWLAGHQHGGVIACSALKRAYRDVIRGAVPDAVFVHLTAPEHVLAARVDARLADGQHFMASSMLASQFADLEPLGGDELGTTVEVADRSATRAYTAAKAWIDLWGSAPRNAVSRRLIREVERAFPPSTHPGIIRVIGTRGSERLQAALVRLADGDLDRLRVAAAEPDWRDVLVAAGLEHEGWSATLDSWLGPETLS
jgi:carbohydrate kinase (thermoresistant glucokinase family)